MTNSVPFVTIIMPIRNEADFIARSLGAVVLQDYPHDRMEVLVADGMSTDTTRQVIGQITSTTGIPITIVDNVGGIVPTGFNAAFRQARGDIIVRVDGHCEIAPNYVSQCVKHLQSGEASGVGGPIETISQNKVGETIAVAMSSSFGVGGSAFRTVKDKTLYTDTIAFPAYRREIVEAAGAFDEELVRNQDDEYNYRLRSLGHKLLLTPDIQSRYYSRGSLRKLWRQYYQYGFYKVRVMQKHPRQMRPRQFAPVLLVITLGGGAVLGVFLKPLHQLWVIMLGIYAVANFTASVITAYKAGWQHLPLLPIVFAILHFSYGLGFLLGLIKYRNRWHNTDR